MASRFRSLYDPEAQDAMDQVPVAPERPQIDIARAQTLARSTSNPDAQRLGESMLDERRNQQDDAARAAQVAQNKAAKDAEKSAKDAAKTAEAARARGVREAAAQGAKIETDIPTGKRAVATHPDGGIKFEAGKIPDAPLQPVTSTTSIKETSTSPARTTPASNPMIADDGGALGALGGTTSTTLMQPIRDDRGRQSLAPADTATDNRGIQTVTQTDPVTGLPGKKAVGVDQDVYAKSQKDSDFEIRRQEIALRKNRVDQFKMRFNPEWDAVEKPYNLTKSELEKIQAKPFRRNAKGEWEKFDPDTNLAIPVDFTKRNESKAEIAFYEANLKEAQERHNAAKAAYDKKVPAFENLKRNDEEIEAARLKLVEEKIQHDSGLPAAEPEAIRTTGDKSSDSDTVSPFTRKLVNMDIEAARVQSAMSTGKADPAAGDKRLQVLAEVKNQTIEQAKAEAKQQLEARGREIASKFIGGDFRSQQLAGGKPSDYAGIKYEVDEMGRFLTGKENIPETVAHIYRLSANNLDRAIEMAGEMGQSRRYSDKTATEVKKQLSAMKAQFDEAGITEEDRPRMIQDAAKAQAWTEKDADTLRQLSTGDLVINPGSVFGQKDALIAEINASDTTPEAKASAVKRLDAMREAMAGKIFKNTVYADADFNKFAGEQYKAGNKDKAAILDQWTSQQKGRNPIWKAGDAITEGIKTGSVGVTKTLVGGAAGLSALVGLDGAAASMGQASADIGGVIQAENEAAKLRGMTGGYAITSELTNTVAQMAPMLVGGVVAGGMKGASQIITRGASVYGWAAAQGYESKLSDAVNMAAEKKGSALTSDEIAGVLGQTDTQVAGFLNAAQTAILAAAFPRGAEAGALGKVSASMTVSDFLRRGGMRAVKDGTLRKELKSIGKNIFADAKDEALEEFTNQVLDGMISVAALDKELQLGTLLEDSFKAGSMGGLVGGGLPQLYAGQTKQQQHEQLASTLQNQMLGQPDRSMVSTALATIDPQTKAPTESELKQARQLVQPSAAVLKDIAERRTAYDAAIKAKDYQGAAAIDQEINEKFTQAQSDAALDAADAVMLTRDLAGLEQQGKESIAQAEQAVTDAWLSGDKKAAAIADANLDQVIKDAPKVSLTRAAVKLGTGQDISALTDAELRAVGLKPGKDGSYDPMTPKELADAGLSKPLVRAGADGSVVILDEAVEQVAQTSPLAAGRIQLGEQDAMQAAQARFNAAQSTTPPPNEQDPQGTPGQEVTAQDPPPAPADANAPVPSGGNGATAPVSGGTGAAQAQAGVGVDDTAIAGETNASLQARTQPGPERHGAVTARRAAAIRVVDGLKPGDIVIDEDTGESMIVNLVIPGTGKVFFEKEGEPRDVAIGLIPDLRNDTPSYAIGKTKASLQTPELMTATRYEQSIKGKPNAPSGKAVVQAAIKAGKPVSVSMARDMAGIMEAPKGYVQIDSTYQPATAQFTRAELSTEQEKASIDVSNQVLANLRAKTSVKIRLQGKGEAIPSGGVVTNLDGSITVIVADVADAMAKGKIADPVEYFTELAIRHEVMHVAQVETVREKWEQSGALGTFEDFFFAYHAPLYQEIARDHPEVLAKAINRYGATAWQGLQKSDDKGDVNQTLTDGLRGAELFRMFGEDLMSGESSEILEASIGKVALKMMEDAIKFIKDVLAGKISGVTLSEDAKAYANEMVKRYSEITGREIAPVKKRAKAPSQFAAERNEKIKAMVAADSGLPVHIKQKLLNEINNTQAWHFEEMHMVNLAFGENSLFGGVDTAKWMEETPSHDRIFTDSEYAAVRRIEGLGGSVTNNNGSGLEKPTGVSGNGKNGNGGSDGISPSKSPGQEDGGTNGRSEFGMGPSGGNGSDSSAGGRGQVRLDVDAGGNGQLETGSAESNPRNRGVSDRGLAGSNQDNDNERANGLLRQTGSSGEFRNSGVLRPLVSSESDIGGKDAENQKNGPTEGVSDARNKGIRNDLPQVGARSNDGGDIQNARANEEAEKEKSIDPDQALRDATETIRQAVVAALESNPALKGTDLGFDLEDIAFDMAPALATVPADKRQGMVDAAISAWLEDNIAEKPAKDTGTTDQKARRKAWRQAAQDKLNNAARAILNSGVHEAFSAVFDKGRITPMPNILGLIRKRRADGKVLTQKEIDVWQNESEWNGALKKSNYTGGGQNPLARAMIELIMARQGEGQSPNTMADALKRIGTGKLKGMDSASDMWEQLAKELRTVTSGKDEDKAGFDPMDDPNYEPTDAEIAAWEAKQQAAEEKRNSQPHVTLGDAHGYAIETFGPDAAITQKIGAVADYSDRFSREDMPVIRGIIADEFQRHAAGQALVEAGADAFEGPGGGFRKFFVSNTPETLVKTLAALPVVDAGSALFSSPLQASPFYSQLSRTLEEKMPKNAPIAQVIQIAASGAKAEEVKWSGLVQALQTLAVDGKVSKDAVLKYLADEGSVKFEEVELSDTERKGSVNDWAVSDGENNTYFRSYQEAAEYANQQGISITDDTVFRATNRRSEASVPKFAQYTLPGGENYREVVLAMPVTKKAEPKGVIAERIKRRTGATDADLADYLNSDASEEIQADGEFEAWINASLDDRFVAAGNRATLGVSDYTSSHFPDVPNYVAHMRVNDRDGGLFIEELQSDRHQAGRKQGYGLLSPAETEDYYQTLNEYGGESNRYFTQQEAEDHVSRHGGKFEKRQSITKKEVQGIADAPFRTTWPIALFKRALRDAVAGGKTWIGWTVGETQNDRFDLSKTLERVTAMTGDNGATFRIQGVDLQGNPHDFGTHPADKLEGVVGKELASKIIEQKTANEIYKGDQLKVGGSGMKGFYDNMLPKEIGKYVKQWNAKVEKANLSGRTKEDLIAERSKLGDSQADVARHAELTKQIADIIWKRAQDGTPIWRIDITPEMRKSVSAGQALFSSPTSGEFSFNQTTDAGDQSQKGFNFDTLRPGPNAKFIENTQKAYDNATTDKARENIAEASAKREGLSRGKVQNVPQGMMDFGMSGSFGTKDQPGLFSSPSNQRSLDFGTTGSFNTRNQPGFDFGATEKSAEPPSDQPRVETATGSPSQAATPSQSTRQTTGLADFGEVLPGARKNQQRSIAQEFSDDYLANQPLSKIWPKGEVDSIEDLDMASIAHALRDEVPAKPRQGYKVARWVKQVKMVRELMRHAEEMGPEALLERMNINGTDLTNLVHKIRLLRQLPRQQWARIGKVSDNPDAYRYERVEGETEPRRIKSPYARAMVDDSGIMADSIDALTPKVQEKLGTAQKPQTMKFEVRGTDIKGYGINKKGDPLYRRLITFPTTKEAFEYIKSHYDSLSSAWEAVKDSDNVKETDVRGKTNRPRAGKDHLQGRDATPEMFTDALGFRGVEFGNWVAQGGSVKDRQGMLNLAFEAFHDLADIMGIPAKAVSLNGTLGLAFGSRGSGSASAHYEPDTLVINLTKTKGAGVLSHEWFHALDNYFQKQRPGKSNAAHGGNYITYQPEAYYENARTGHRLSAWNFNRIQTTGGRFDNIADWKRIEGVRPEVEERFAELVKALDASPMNKRAKLIDKGKSDGYWSRVIERAARSFENYTIAKMQQKGYHNDYLANVVSPDSFVRDINRYPYLLEDEVAPIVEAFDNLFGTIQTEETDKGVRLFSSPTPVDKSAIASYLESNGSPTAATASDATQKLGQVKVGSMNALGAYRTLTAKRNAGKTLTADEEQKLLDAETALGQKLAFDMDALKGSIPPEPTAPEKAKPATQGQRSTQQSMFMGPETTQDGQMSLFSSPTPSILERPHFHSTSNEEAALQILKDGEVKAPALSGRGGKLTPVIGKTYMSPSNETAAIYSLGGVMMGHEYNWQDRGGRAAGQYGYVFQIDPDSMKDIQPDEDSIGELFAKSMDSKASPSEYPSWIKSMGMRHATERQISNIKDGFYADYAAVGKKLVKVMTDEQKIEIIDQYAAHVANEGSARVIRAWRVDKSRSKEIAKDGRNLFEVAEQVFGDSPINLYPAAAFGSKRRDVQDEISRAGEIDKSGQMSLFSSPTPAQDAEYLALAKDPEKNREALQKMVDEAAKKAGYSLGPFFHGTDSDFTVFDKGGRVGIYLTPDEKLAKAYGRKVLKVYANITKGAKADAELTTMENTRRGYDALVSVLKTYDGLIAYPSDGGSREVLLRDPNQIKSADPVTYDASGQVIPLSQRFNPQSDSILYSSPAPDPAKVIDWKKFPPVFRLVYAAILEGQSVSQIAKKLRITEKAVTNISTQISTRVQALDEAADGKLTPKMKDGLIERGRPERAMSTTSPEVARILQIRQDNNDPEAIANAETYANAKKMIAKDYAGTIERIVNRRANGEDLTLDEVAAAQMILLGKVGKKRSQMTPEEKVQLGWLAMDWVEQGTDDARRLQIRRDVTHSPAERAALYFAKELYTPQDKATLDALKNAKGRKAKEEVMKRFMERSEGLKNRLKERGIDLEASLEEFRRQQDEKQAMEEAVKQAHDRLTNGYQDEVDALQDQLAKANEATAAAQAVGIASEAQIAKMQADAEAMAEKLKKARTDLSKARMLEPGLVLRTALLKLTDAEKAAMETLLNGGTIENALAVGGMTQEALKKVYTNFGSVLKRARLEAQAMAKQRMLEMPPVLMSSAMESDELRMVGYVPWGEIEERKSPITPEQVRQKPKKQPKAKPAEPVTLTPEQQAAIDAAFEEFKAADPSTWSAWWQETAAKLTPMIGQTSFEQFKERVMQPWKDRWQTEMDGIANPSARITFEEWIAKPSTKETAKRERELFLQPINETTGTFDATAPNREGSLFPAPINETTGTWNDTRPYTSQGELIREEINETRGIIDFNDLFARKRLWEEFAGMNSTRSDKVMEFWKASILSGPQTGIRNLLSNAGFGIFKMVPRRALEAAVNSSFKLVGLGSDEAATFGEFAAMAKHLRNAAHLASRTMFQSWQLESPVFEYYALGLEQQIGFNGVKGEPITPALRGKLRKVMHGISFRHMMASDQFAQAYFGHLEAVAQAHRIAKAEGLKGTDYEARMDQLIETRGSEAWQRAFKEMQINTFQEPLNPEGSPIIHRFDQAADFIMKLRQAPYLGKPLSLIWPFVMTPSNIAKQAIIHSPIGGILAVTDAVRALHRKLGAGKLDARGMRITKEEANQAAAEIYDKARFVRDLTNQTIAYGVYFMIAQMLEPDDDDDLPWITGTTGFKSDTRGERDAENRVMPALSIRLPGMGNSYYSYSGLDPLASLISGTVDVANDVRRTGGVDAEVMGRFFVHVRNAMADKTYLKGLSDLAKAWDSPDRFIPRMAGNIATGFVPNLIRQPIRESDSVQRDVYPREGDGVAMSMAKRVGFSVVPQAAPPKLSIWGKQLPSNNGIEIGGPMTDWMIRVIDPGNLTIGAEIDPIDRYITNWNDSVADDGQKIQITPLDGFITAKINGKQQRIPLTIAEQEQAIINVGKAARETLGDGWDYKKPTHEGARQIIETFRKLNDNERAILRDQKLAEMQVAQ